MFAKNEAYLLLENEIFEGGSLYYICNSKSIKIYPNQHADLHRIFFTEDSLKIKKDLQAIFFEEFLDKKNYFVILHKLTKFHYQAAFASQFIQ